MSWDPFAVLNHVWQSTLVAALAWVACATVFRANSARIRFGIWHAVSMKFLVPFAALVEAGRLFGMRAPLTPRQSQQMLDLVTAGPPVVAAAPFPTSATPQAATVSEEFVLTVLAAVWALGAAVVFSRWLKHWWTIRAVARDARPAGAIRGVPVLSSQRMRDQRIEPGVFGVWRQAILIPAGIDDRLSKTQRRSILEHEWHHAQRRDNLAAWLHMIVQAVFWFHPVVWLIGRRLIEEREMACDEAVLASSPPDDYAEGILNVCKFYCAPSHSQAAGITSADLKTRVEMILKNEQPRELGRSRRWALAAALSAAVMMPTAVGVLTAQAAAAQQGNSFLGLATSVGKKFEVATVKPNTSGTQAWRLGPPSRGSISIVNFPLRNLIVQAFRTNSGMVFGGPDWIRTANYDIVAKGPDPTAANPEVWEMMRSLLIDRFKLKYHIENRELPVYALVVAPRGHKLTPGENGHCAEMIKAGNSCGDILIPPFGAAMVNMPIGALLNGIERRAGRPVIDQTGLTGRYDANITWLPDGAKLEELNLENVPPEFRPQDVNMFEALEQQAGLKLEPQRASLPVVVIDSISQPDPD
jgi:bla regulator protein blaR1